ncbi:Matrix metalloproteinase-25 [Myotis brandtii]|uniref:Matrix metalloproteinase-25 n=1 Tax=Myotis brandtii TaxID=109478 RepID=S7MNL9_MYOBR|nr:Matrix metalloproteinase-25 [Myotis brandtii]
MATMHKPRCSLPDVLGVAELVRRRRRRYALSGSIWKKRTLTWRIHSFPRSSALSQETVRTLMHHALAAWGIESGLKFREVGSQGPPEADILIDFVRAYHQDSYPFDGQGGTLAHAFFPGEHSISGDTHFDDEEIWTFGSKDGEGTDLFAVAVHEFGHALGLGHSSAPDSIMRPFYQGPVGEPTKYRLSQDDREGLQQLYGKGPQTPYDKPTMKPLAPPPPPPALPPGSPSLPVPDRCDGNFDAIANIRGETFFFKGPWFWRLQPSGQLVSPRPARLHRFWEGLPPQVTVIQAAYTRHRDGRILLFSGATYFFKGAHYWRFPKGSVKADPDSPQPMGPQWLDCPAPSAGPRYPRPPKATLKPEPCNCHCEINQAAGRLSSSSSWVTLLLLLLPLLVGDITSR